MPDETIEHKRERYIALAHAMQSGVAQMMHHDPKATEPKHLRVGINTAHTDHSALAKLLMDKGLFTESEYYDALITAMEREVQLYERELSERMGGANIHLV